MKVIVSLFIAMLCLSTLAYADDSEKIQELEERLDELENNSNKLAKFADSIPIQGFMDVQSGYNVDTGKLEFKTGAVDFYLTKDIGSVKTLIELIFETDGDDLVTDLERVQIGYEFDMGLTVWGGRFHTPYGYWNTAYHHGAQIQTSILRPKFIDFEDAGGIMPSHSTGIWLVDRIGDFGYDIYVTNGSNILASPENNTSNAFFGELNMNKGGDDNFNKAVGANFYYDIDDLRLGVHGLTQIVDIFNGSQSELIMYGGYLVYDDSELEIMAELYMFNNTNKIDTIGTNTNKTYSSYASFVQAAYNVIEDWTPFLRYEIAELDSDDVYFASQSFTTGPSYKRFATGVKYDLNQDSALKLEYYYTDEEALGSIPAVSTNNVLLQFAVRF